MLYILAEGWKVNRTAEVQGYLQLFSNHISILLSQEIFVFRFRELHIQNVLGIFFASNNAELLFGYR